MFAAESTSVQGVKDGLVEKMRHMVYQRTRKIISDIESYRMHRNDLFCRIDYD